MPREWGYSRKKTQPIMVSRTPIEEVNKWRAGLYQKIARYTKMGYTIVTQDGVVQTFDSKSTKSLKITDLALT